MLHVWLVPLLVVFFAALAVFYLCIKYRGGNGVRTSGRAVVDELVPDEDPPP